MNPEEIKPFETTDVDEADVLVAELADTTIIDTVMDDFIGATSEVFSELIEISHNGNPVATHMALLSTVEAVETALYDLKQELLDSLAKHGDEFDEKGGNLRKQVVDEGE
jgi:hypothetical protein